MPIFSHGEDLRAIDRASVKPKIRTFGVAARNVNDAPAKRGKREPIAPLADKAPSLQGVSKGVSGSAMARHHWILAGRRAHPIFSRSEWLEANTFDNLVLPLGADKLCFGCGYHDYCRCDKPKYNPEVVTRVPVAARVQSDAPKVPEARFYTRHGVPVF